MADHLDAPGAARSVIESLPGGVIIAVRVIPRASRPGIGGVREGALLVRVNAPPVEGAANEAVVDLLADVLGVARRQVTIVSGARGRQKRVRVTGVDSPTASARLAPVIARD